MLSRAIDQNGVLVIPNIQRSDAGNYVCMGSDINHMEEAIATLIVTARKYRGFSSLLIPFVIVFSLQRFYM
jgi:hypothetical protein